MNDKIQAHHQARLAVVYVRQSSTLQIRTHLESQERQHALQQRAEQLGWPAAQVLVLDEERARSATSTHGRHAFHELCELVTTQRVGMILAVEVARWARDNVAWQMLLRDCAFENVLLSDDHRLYDPNDSHDHVTLGIQGVLAEYEIRVLQERTLECWWNKARRYEMFCAIPNGFVLVEGKLHKHPHRRVRNSVQRLFAKFQDFTSVFQLYRWYQKQEELLPFVAQGDDPQDVQWRTPSYKRLLEIVKNPAYAGTYVIGRRESTKVRNDAGEIVARQRSLPIEQWKVVEHNHFEGYISWQQYEQNMAKIEQNKPDKQDGGTARGGVALLSGLLRCMRCGSSLHVQYPRRGRACYVCRGGVRQRELGKRCLSFASPGVESLFSQAILEAVAPAAIEASRQAAQAMRDDSRPDRQVLVDQLQQLEYQAERARRQFDRVEPENRLVADELERRWNQALESAHALRERVKQFDAQHPTRAWDESLTSWFNSQRWEEVWWSAANQRKKQIVDVLVREVVVDLSESGDEVLLWIHWQGGHHTSLSAPRGRRSGGSQHGDLKKAITLLRRVRDDGSMARVLNRHGIQAPYTKESPSPNWTAKSVRQFRERYSIAPHDPAEQRSQGFMTGEEAARKLEISAMSVHRLIAAGILPAEQALPGLPCIILSRDLDQPEIQNAAQRIRSSLPRPLTANPKQKKLF